MADRIVGFPYAVIVSGDVLTFPVDTFDEQLNDEFDTITGYALKVNGTPSTSKLTAIGGLQGDGTYQATLTAGHGLVTGDLVALQNGNTTLTYTTLASAWTASTADSTDTLRVYCQNVLGSTHWKEVINGGSSTTKAVSIIGMLPKQRVTVGTGGAAVRYFYALLGNLSVITGKHRIANLTIGKGGSGGIQAYDSTDSATWGGATIERNKIVSGGYGIYVRAKVGRVIARNNIVTSCITAGIVCAIGAMKILGNTVIGCTKGIDNGNKANDVEDNLCISNTVDIASTAVIGSFLNNWTMDSSGQSTGKREDGIEFSGYNANNNHPFDWRVDTTSPTIGAGVANADLVYDIDGNARSATPAVGASEGVTFATPIDYPAVGDVEQGVVFDSGAKTGTFVVPAEADVEQGVDFGAAAEFTGTFVVPAIGDVRFATTYGAAAEFTGTLDLPAVADVEQGVIFDATTKTGTFVAPAVGDVRLATTYGAAAEFTGTLVVVPIPKDLGPRSTGNKRNTLRQLAQMLYRLKRNYGKPVDIYQPLTNTVDVKTQETTRTYNITRLARVVVLEGEQLRTFAYDLSFIAANKNFTYGGYFDRDTRGFVIDRADLAANFELDLNDHLVYLGRRYEIKSINATAGGYGYFALASDVSEAPDQVQHRKEVYQTIGMTQNVTGS